MPRPTRMSSLFSRRTNGRNAPRKGRRLARRRESLVTERLEGRQMLAVTVGRNPLDLAQLVVTYDAVAGQAVTLEIEDDGIHNFPVTPFAAGVNVYSSDTPSAQFFDAITSVVVTVLNPTQAGVNDNSLAIKGINTGNDRIILAGSALTDPNTGRLFSNVAGRWSNELPGGNQMLFTISGIDDLTVTAGGIINVSGSFVNDTNDASVHAIGEIAERAAAQHTATVIVGETTPQTGVIAEPWLFSNTVEIVGGEVDIYANIGATIEVTVRAGDSAPADVRSNLVLPYDIVVADPLSGAPVGRVDLFSTQNITQLQSSRIVAGRVVAVSNNDRAVAPDGPWMIDLGSVDNQFNEISLGMIAAPGDAVVAGTQGRIGVRNSIDLNVVDFGILASTAQVRIDNAGALTVSAPITATGLVLESDDSITTTAGAIMRLGALGIQLYANDTHAPTSLGNITLNGPIIIKDDAAPATIVTNKIEAAGTVTMAGGFFCPLPGSTTVTSKNAAIGVVVTGPIQVGSATLNANSTAVTICDHTLALISLAGDINVLRMAGNAVVPHAIQATETISFDAAGDISIAGSVFSGVMYGNPAALVATEALPSITIKALGNVDVTTTGSLRTKAYQTNPDVTTNPMVGLISVTDAAQFKHQGVIVADGAVHIGDGADTLNGDVYLWGTTTARENIRVVATGSIDVLGAVRSTGGTYAAVPATDSQRFPNVILTALGTTGTGAISTGGAGTITAGVINGTNYGRVILTAQQDVDIDAAINTPGAIDIDTKFGTVSLSALLQTNNAQAMTITAGNGIFETDTVFGRIVTDSLTLTNNDGVPGSGLGDIILLGVNNKIGTVAATNFAPGGDVQIANNLALNIATGGINAVQDPTNPSTVSLASRAGIIQTGAIIANNLSVTNVGTAAIRLTSPGNDVDNLAALNPVGNITYNDADDYEIGVSRPADQTKLGVEVSGVDVLLTSTAAYSTIRVVSGLQYRTLAIGAANATGATVGTVQFVVTSQGDNPAPAGRVPTFAGTLRDMIRYINDNTAVYVANQTTRSQPMAVAFDEFDDVAGAYSYDVSTITVGRGPGIPATSPLVPLPAFRRAVTFDAGRMTDAVLATGQTRLNITQAAPNPGQPGLPSGLSFAAATPAVPGSAPAYPGASGSSIRHLAMYGFTQGSALVLGSGNNTVTDFYAGLNDAGVFSGANLVGLDITGTTATNNLVGSDVFDVNTANRFGGNTSAGILIRNGAAGNRFYGNVIGDETGFTPQLANGDGIRISAATGNLIGTPDEVQPDQTDSVSNVIAGNLGNGVSIVNAVAGSSAAGNVIRNNLITRNRAGVAVTNSKFAIIGGSDGESGNTITFQKGDGVSIAASSGVSLLGNRIGITPASDVAPEALSGNGGNGVTIGGASSGISIASANRISGNTGHGVSVGTGVTGVTIAGNTIGGLLDDGVTAAGNGIDGVSIFAAIGNSVGAGNTISKNGRNGVSVIDSRAANLAAGNRILGSTIADNTGHGVYLAGGAASTVGGTAAGNGNVITANLKSGIYLERTKATGAPTGYAIQGNFVGTNTNRDVDSSLGNLSGGVVVNDGVSVRIEANTVMNNLRADDPNNANDPNDGITLRGGTGNVVGGTTAAQGNIVTNNVRDGIRILGASAARPAQGHWISGNTITDNGDETVQAGNGVTVTGAFARGIMVGQSVTTAGVRGLGNVIQRNAVNGVTVAGGAQQVSIQGNSLAENLRAAIYIAPGSNESAAMPGVTLTRATLRQPSNSQMQVLLQGSLTKAVKGQQYTIDVYANTAPIGVGFPQPGTAVVQAQRFVGRVTVTATADGTIVWGASNPIRISANVSPGEYITATVTALRVQPGSTSNLSNFDAASGQSRGVIAARG